MMLLWTENMWMWLPAKARCRCGCGYQQKRGVDVDVAAKDLGNVDVEVFVMDGVDSSAMNQTNPFEEVVM